MKLFLIRHGETVDNVAGLYAGVRDSTLTNHGAEQTRKLGQYFAKNGVQFTHVFASPLCRAFKTAEAIVEAQPRTNAQTADTTSKKLSITKVPEIIERDFGYYEGKPFSSRSGPRNQQDDEARNQSGFVDAENAESMATRIETFLDGHLVPLFDSDHEHGEHVVAIVSHGMLLSHLWRRLLLRLPRKSLTIAPEVTVVRDNIILEHVGGWSNTGYMELSVRKITTPAAQTSVDAKNVTEVSKATDTAALPTPVPPFLEPEAATVSVAPVTELEKVLDSKISDKTLTGWSTTILAIDSKAHLTGLKRQRGGIGSSAHDEGQKKLDAFFKKPKLT